MNKLTVAAVAVVLAVTGLLSTNGSTSAPVVAAPCCKIFV